MFDPDCKSLANLENNKALNLRTHELSEFIPNPMEMS